MNARELAVALDVNESTVSRLLSGDRRPSVDLMIKVRAVFPGWSIDGQTEALTQGRYGTTLGQFMKERSGLDTEASTSVE